MRVLMVGISPQFGGTEAVIYSMLEEWRKHGVIVDFINAFQKPLANEQWLRSLGSEIFPLDLRRRGRYFEYKKSIHRFFQERQGRFDAIFLNIQEPVNATLLAEAKRIGIQNRIVLAHSSATPYGVGWLRRVANWCSKRKLSKYATKRVGVSPLACRYAYCKRHASIVIRSGIEVKRFQFDPRRRHGIRDNLGLNESTEIYAFVGRLTEEKNPYFLLDVFEAIHSRKPEARFLIVGDGEMAPSLQTEVRKGPLIDSVIFVGHQADVAPWLDASDYLLLPSRHEGMGMSLIEAQFSGLTCFASAGPIPKEAKISDLLSWIPLENGVQHWAEVILSTPKTLHRESNAISLENQQLDAISVANRYLGILLDS